jgi:hypothetical protein
MKMEAHPIFIVEFLAGYLPTSLALGASNTGV